MLNLAVTLDRSAAYESAYRNSMPTLSFWWFLLQRQTFILHANSSDKSVRLVSPSFSRSLLCLSLSLSLSPPPPLWLPAEVSWCEGKSRAIYFLANRKANLWELKSKRGQANEKENSQPSKTRKAQNPPPLFLSSSLLALLWGERGCEVLGDDPHTSKQAVHVTRT